RNSRVVRAHVLRRSHGRRGDRSGSLLRLPRSAPSMTVVLARALTANGALRRIRETHRAESIGWATSGMIVAVVLGFVAPYLPESLGAVALLLTLSAVPGLIVLAQARPVLTFGLFFAAQPLEAFEIQSPVGSYSVGIIILAALLVTRFGPFIGKARGDALLRRSMIVLAAWLVYLVPSRYGYMGSSAFREALTMSSFVAVTLVAASLPGDLKTFKSAAVGATSALAVLAVCGVAVGEHWIKQPIRTTAPRDILGFTSPFPRNYGLNIPFDAVTLLSPLVISWFAVRLVRREGRGNMAALALLVASILFVFQGRDLLMQVAIGLAVAFLVVYRKAAPFVVIASAVPVLYLYERLAAVDQISTTSRSASDLQVLHTTVAHPLHYLIGTNEEQVFSSAVNQAGLGDAFVSHQNTIHNLFLSNLVGGGYVALALIGIAYI